MIVILDCGSQLTHNIARRVREQNVYCEVLPYHKMPVGKIEGIIISGSPASVYDNNAPFYNANIFDLGIPVLGICYGMQSMAHILGGKVEKSDKREYGRMLFHAGRADIFNNIPLKSTVWMSHGDKVVGLPEGFTSAGSSANSQYAAMYDPDRKLYGVQFHIEVDHTEYGRQIISNFIDICGCNRDWTANKFIDDAVDSIRKQVGGAHVIGGVSGGVDSSVASALMYRAIGDNFHPIFVDHGLLRKNEAREVLDAFNGLGIKLNYVDASERFFQKLAGISEPEKKRKIIGKEFIEVFQHEASKYGKAEYLMQGTLYPDVIESVTVFGGPTSTIKSHHNVGGLPKDMNLKLIEPLRYLFKDEVRNVGEELGLPKEIVWRHPFPGPGLAIRIIGDVTREKVSLLQDVDSIFIEELKSNNLYYDHTWQAFAVLTNIRTVGVMGDERTYSHLVGLRAVTSNDGMTADFARLPWEILGKVGNRIINEVKGVNRVVYDITSKPPGTIEWE